ncbi:MAG TPA: phytoene/squalene synthase family protein [Capillimicrobium sp.]
MESERELGEAYRVCARLQRRRDPTFWWATQRLPAAVRPAVHALYGYVRVADDLVDGRDRLRDPASRRAALDAWQRELDDGLAAGCSDEPVVAALVDAARRHALPLGELRAYMDSMRVDCGPVRIGCAAELDRYMHGSAAAVGRIMAPLLGAPSDELAAMGVAFQLTNFVRDVPEDWALDRIYLPGVTDADLAGSPTTARVRERVAAEVARARDLFAATADVPAALSPRLRPGVRLARSVYGRVLDRVERLDFDVVARRAALTPLDLGRAAVGR